MGEHEGRARLLASRGTRKGAEAGVGTQETSSEERGPSDEGIAGLRSLTLSECSSLGWPSGQLGFMRNCEERAWNVNLVGGGNH